MIALHRIIAFFVTRLGYREIISDLIFFLCLAFAWRKPQFCRRFWEAIERAGSGVARHKGRAIVFVAAAAILIRLSLLWLLPIPFPRIHDEFSYLLAGDTFAHGRLTNPTHPEWIFFDTVHVLQRPTYMSKYPPAQGAVLAVGQLLGSPWIGVLLSVALMCAALLWMLQGWLPPRWALLGGILALFRLDISSYWINSFWGGAAAAIGGALVVGAMPRILRCCKTRDALLLGFGAAILANSRPVEGFVICAPVTAILCWWLCGGKSPSPRITLVRLVLPFLFVVLLCGIFMEYYNWRITRNPFLFPEELYNRQYFAPPPFIWQRFHPYPGLQSPVDESFKKAWMPNFSWSYTPVDSMASAAKHEGVIILKLLYFYMWPELCVPLLALPWILRDRRIRYLIVQFGICFVGWFLVIWFLPHYAAPATPIIFALLVQAIRHLRHWEYRGRPLGIGLSRVVVLFAVVLAVFQQRQGTIQPVTSEPPVMQYREKFSAALAAMPGQHLALVRFGNSDSGGEWIYNAADIDHAKIVWAREIPGADIRPLLDYFHGRSVWRVEPGASPPRITPVLETAPR